MLNMVTVIKIFYIKNIKLRNSLSTSLKQSKKRYNNYFKNKIDNIKNTWTGIKPIISVKVTSATI